MVVGTSTRSRRIVVATDDVLSRRMAGPAIRAWNIAAALSTEHEVVLATTSACDVEGDRFTAEAADGARFEELERWCDVVVVQGYLLHNVPGLRRSSKIMVFDLYDPLHLEALELTRGMAEPERSFHVGNSARTLEEQLVRGDFFLCASERQRDFWLGFLAAAGRVNPRTYGDDATLRRLIDVVPFGLPDEAPAHHAPALRGVVDGIGADDEVVLWGGGIYDWFDPVTAVRAVDRVRLVRPTVRLFFMGMRHPKPDVLESPAAVEARRVAGELGLTGTHVFFNDGWVAYEDRANYLLEADVAVSLHHRSVETRFSFRTRMLDYLWAGLPVVATEGDGFAPIVSAEDLGVVVPDADVDAVAAALEQLLGDPGRRAACRRRAGAVAARYRWSVALRPLLAFCADAHRAPDDPSWRPPGAPTDDAQGPPPVVTGPAALRQDLRRALDLYRTGGARAVAVDARRWIRRRRAP